MTEFFKPRNYSENPNTQSLFIKVFQQFVNSLPNSKNLTILVENFAQ